jgi:hypothetical protein
MKRTATAGEPRITVSGNAHGGGAIPGYSYNKLKGGGFIENHFIPGRALNSIISKIKKKL